MEQMHINYGGFVRCSFLRAEALAREQLAPKFGVTVRIFAEPGETYMTSNGSFSRVPSGYLGVEYYFTGSDLSSFGEESRNLAHDISERGL